MKKLITIFLIMATTFAMQAQKKVLNKEETVEYLKNMMVHDYWKTKYDEEMCTDLSVDANIIKIKFIERFSFMNQKIEVNSYSKPINSDGGIYYRNVLLFASDIESEADRFKRAFEHLLELLKTDDSDPFGN